MLSPFRMVHLYTALTTEAQFLSVTLMPQRSTYHVTAANAAIHHWGVHRPQTLSAEVKSLGVRAYLSPMLIIILTSRSTHALLVSTAV